MNSLVESVVILNKDDEISTLSASKIITNNVNASSYIVSDTDEEMLILIQFKQIVELNKIKLHAMTDSIQSINDQNDCDVSQPKQIHVYKIKNTNVSFNDVTLIQPNKSIKCSVKKLQKGQTINMMQNAKNVVQFKKIRCLAIYIQSNQNNTENTYLNGISLFGNEHQYETEQILTNANKSKEYALSKISKARHDLTMFDDQFDSTCLDNNKKLQQFAEQFAEEKLTDQLMCDYFITEEKKQSTHNTCCKVSECLSMKRMINTLKSYTSFIKCRDMQENKDDAGFDTICAGISVVLNDFHHLLQEHSHEFEDIYENIINNCNNRDPCIFSKCILRRRNTRNRSQTKYQDFKKMYCDYFEKQDIATQQILDTIHCHYLHSFDIGYKICAADFNIIQSKCINANRNGFFEDELLTATHQFLKDKKSSETQLITSKFKSDLGDHYDYGVRYFYWSYYKNALTYRDECRRINETQFGPHANVGYFLFEWYIRPKYKHLKHEMLNNKLMTICTIEFNYQHQVATLHRQSEYGRTFRAMHHHSKLYFDIEKNEVIAVDHVLAMMIYCNYTALQSVFSSTYRHLESETDDDLKKRHCNYVHLGRLLRECVECFDTTKRRHNVFVKLYHGVSKTYQFRSLKAGIKGPFSTTTEYSVAFNFTANNGMILELSMDMYFQNGSITMFDCQWLSNYSQEHEIFYIGGFSEFLITNIIHVPTANNYCLYVTAVNSVSWWLGDPYSALPLSSKLKLKPEFEDYLVYRILAHHLYLQFPSDPLYENKMWKGLPKYANQFSSSSLAHITGIHLLKTDMIKSRQDRINSIFRTLFFYDWGWVNLSKIFAVFPSVECISFVDQMNSDEFIQNQSLYASILSFIKNNPNFPLKEIYIKFPSKHEVITKVEHIINKFTHLYSQLDWTILVQQYTDLDDLDFPVYHVETTLVAKQHTCKKHRVIIQRMNTPEMQELQLKYFQKTGEWPTHLGIRTRVNEFGGRHHT